MLLPRAGGLLAAVTRNPLVEAWAARFSSLTREVAEANQELDDFFGVSHHNRLPASRPHHSVTTMAATQATDSPFTAQHPSPTGTSSRGPGGWVIPANLQDAGVEAPAASYPAAVGASYPEAVGLSASSAGYSSSGGASRGGSGSDDGVANDLGRQVPRLATLPQGDELQRRLTHIDSTGSASMVDVSQKDVTVREAQASCVVALGDAFGLVAANAVAKGDVLKVAQLAGICGAKATASLVPLCHNIPISKVDVQLHLDEPSRSVVVRALARTDGKTGVEMEALTAASVAALTVYDMCKAAAKDMVVRELQLDYKSGGRSGTYLRAGLRRADLLPSSRPPL